MIGSTFSLISLSGLRFAQNSSNIVKFLSNSFWLNFTWIASSTTKVLELYTLNALDVLEYPRNVSLSLFESNFPQLSSVLRMKHLHLNGWKYGMLGFRPFHSSHGLNNYRSYIYIYNFILKIVYGIHCFSP